MRRTLLARRFPLPGESLQNSTFGEVVAMLLHGSVVDPS